VLIAIVLVIAFKCYQNQNVSVIDAKREHVLQPSFWTYGRLDV
jgi:hypothetical protein